MKQTRLLPFLAMALALAAPRTASAQAGSLDPVFASAGQFVQDFGAQDNLTKVRVQNDGRIVAVGTALSPAFSGRLLVLRLNADGTPDTGFNGTGSLLITAFNESYAYDLFFDDADRIVVVGARADQFFQFSMLALRLNPDGSLDNSFGTGGISELEISTGDDFAYAVAPLPNGQMLLAGSALDSGFRNQPVMVRLNSDGSIDEGFGSNGVADFPITEQDNNFWSIGVQGSGRIIAAGQLDQGLTSTGQFNQDVLVAAFTPQGEPDAGFGVGGSIVRAISAEYNDRALAMAIGPDDAIYLGGYATQPNFSFDAFVMKLDANGADDLAFGGDGLAIFDNAVQDVFTGLMLQPDGKLLACGTSGGFFFDPRDQLVARFTTTGMLDSGYDGDGFSLHNVAGNFDEANAIALQADGKIVTAGKANTGLNNDITVFRYLNDINTMIDEHHASAALSIYPNPARAGGIVMLSAEEDILGTRLVAAHGAEVVLAQRPTNGPWRMVAIPEGLAPGAYTLQALTPRGRYLSTRLIVQD